MSWGELSCAHYHAKGPCPNPKVSYETCHTKCLYYKKRIIKRSTSDSLMNSLPRSTPPVVLQIKRAHKKKKKKRRRK